MSGRSLVKIEEHSNNEGITPRFVVGFASIGIDSERKLNCCRPVWVAVSQSCGINDSLDDTLLSESDGVIICRILDKFSAKEISKHALVCELAVVHISQDSQVVCSNLTRVRTQF